MTIWSSTYDLRGAVPLNCEYLEVLIVFAALLLLLRLMLEVGEWLFIISEIPQFDCAVYWPTYEEIFDLGVEFDLGYPSAMAFVGVGHLLRGSLLSGTGIPKADDGVFTACQREEVLGGV